MLFRSLLTVLLYIILLILVPVRLVKQYVSLGLAVGTLQAIIVLWIFQFQLALWQLIGDPVVLGITTVFTPIAWIAPTIIFAAYFPTDRPWYYIIGYILLFAVGAVVAQILLEQVGMWRSIRWNPLLTGLLATGTHTVITIALLTTRARIRT